MTIEPKGDGDHKQIGSLKIPEKDGLPEPVYQFPSDVVFQMNQWYDAFLSYPHRSIQDLFKLLAPHLKGEKEQEQFKKSYNAFQLIKTSKSFFTSIDDMLDMFFVLDPKITVFYKLLFGDYSKNQATVYKDVSTRSVYSLMPHLVGLAGQLSHPHKIIIAYDEKNSGNNKNTHLLSAEHMVMKKIKAECPDVLVIPTKEIIDVAKYVNNILAKSVSR